MLQRSSSLTYIPSLESGMFSGTAAPGAHRGFGWGGSSVPCEGLGSSRTQHWLSMLVACHKSSLLLPTLLCVQGVQDTHSLYLYHRIINVRSVPGGSDRLETHFVLTSLHMEELRIQP